MAEACTGAQLAPIQSPAQSSTHLPHCVSHPCRTEADACTIPISLHTFGTLPRREKKGFGSEGRRFGTDETDNPGPGQYSLPESSHRPIESTSKKGYGAMVSKAQRFKHKARYTGPGPGTYVVASYLPDYHIQIGATSSFHPKVSLGCTRSICVHCSKALHPLCSIPCLGLQAQQRVV